MTRQGRADLRYALARKVLSPLTTKLGFTVLADHYYHPVASPSAFQRQAHRGALHRFIDWDLPRQISLVRDHLLAYRSELEAPSVFAHYGYDANRAGIRAGDAELLYAMIRHNRPTSVVELGTGGSTLVIAAALRMNAREGAPRCRFLSVDPSPPEGIAPLRPSVSHYFDYELLRVGAQQVPLGRYRALRENDILFVDSSHIFKPGSDVEFAFLSVYPSLASGVLVHIHDVFFPFDYPQAWNLEEHRYWNELYFLEVFLTCNSRYRVEACLSMVHDAAPDLLPRAIRAFGPHGSPGSFWMRAEQADGPRMLE